MRFSAEGRCTQVLQAGRDELELRHSATTIALDEGVALAVVQELLGHSDIRVTREYTHVSSPLAYNGEQRLGKALFGRTAMKTATRRNER